MLVYEIEENTTKGRKMITKDIAMYCSMYYHITLRNRDGSALRARANGKVKTWKRDPNRFQVPVKHGLRTCLYITESNAGDWLPYDPTEVGAKERYEDKQRKRQERERNCHTLRLPIDVPNSILRDAMKEAGMIPQDA